MSQAIQVARPSDAVARCRAVLAQRSLSFRLATRLLPRECRDDTAIVYAWCRRADDAVDELTDPRAQAEALVHLHRELDELYRGAAMSDPIAAGFQDVVHRRGLAEAHPRALLEGMAMDARGERYATIEQLRGYAYRVAGVVGLMMCAVMGERRPEVLERAVRLGIAMQLTNICRDVAEDWERGRLYLPEELLAEHGAGWVAAQRGRPLSRAAADALRAPVRRLLAIADDDYRAGDRGLRALPWRCGLAIRVARTLYAAIGRRIAARDYDVLAGRAYVSAPRKALLVAGAAAHSIWPSRSS